MGATILVVEDDIPLARAIDAILRHAAYRPVLAHTAEDGLRMARSQRPELALLDVMVPVIGGWELCRQLRNFAPTMPIIFLTALGDTESVVRGLEIGADDYLVKPFERAVLLARIKAHLRRANRIEQQPETLFFGDGVLAINLPERTAQLDGEHIGLTPREFDLLAALARNAGRVVTTAELARIAWGVSDPGGRDNVKPYIHYLRKKIEVQPTSPQWIRTVRGVGYRFVDKP